MPIHYLRDDEKRRVYVTWEGKPTVDEGVAMMDRQAADGAWSYSVQQDVRDGREAPTLEELRQIVMHVGKLTAKHGPRGPVALIVGDPELFKAAKRYALLGELTALNVEMFATPAAAEQWLDSVTR